MDIRADTPRFACCCVGTWAGKDVDEASKDLLKGYTLIKYYGFNPTIKRTVADYIDKKTGKKLRVAKGIISKILKTTEGTYRSPHLSLPTSLSPPIHSFSLSLLLLTRLLFVRRISRFLRAGDGGEQWTVDQYDTVAPKVMEADATFGKSGYKTIAIAIAVGDGPMKYAGTLPIMDPPRADTAETIKKIRFASVDVKMITVRTAKRHSTAHVSGLGAPSTHQTTQKPSPPLLQGDHLNIAKELARQIDLGVNIHANTSLWPASAARDDLITYGDGFAQVMPKDKYEVVAVLQSQGKVVGMTGDGVNDAPALAKAQIGIAVAGATDAAQAASDIVLTKEGLSPIFTAIVQSRKIFKRLKAYVIYRICVTVQVVAFLCVVSFVYNEAFQALYIILLALFHDLTIVTIAYDHQEASAAPEHPTVVMLIVVAYACGLTLAASSTTLYAMGGLFLSDKFKSFEYKESCMFLQVSNSSAFLIFCARTSGFFFLSVPALELFLSAVVSQMVVNLFLLFSGGFIVVQLDPYDIAAIWAYDIAWLLIIDLVKMSINKVQNVEQAAMSSVTSRNSFTAGPRKSSSKTSTRASKAGMKSDVRVSISGQPVTPRGGAALW